MVDLLEKIRGLRELCVKARSISPISTKRLTENERLLFVNAEDNSRLEAASKCRPAATATWQHVSPFFMKESENPTLEELCTTCREYDGLDALDRCLFWILAARERKTYDDTILISCRFHALLGMDIVKCLSDYSDEGGS